MNIGKEIKRLRTTKGLSQNELAEVLNVTAQAVSKWESDISYPDISLLPAIASYFGITIDELFAYPVDLEYERINQSILNGAAVTNEFFSHSEEFLLGEIKKNPTNHRALSLLGALYLFEADCLSEKAVHYAEEALRIKPDNKNELSILNNAMNGFINDWNVGCNFKLIDKLYQMIRNNKENSRTKLYLLDNLIADGRFDEAKQIIQDNPDLELNPVYLVMIQEREYGFLSAKKSYQELVLKYSDNWKIVMEVADRYAYNSTYEEAIELYEICFKIAPKPRYTDMLECIAYLQKHLGNNMAAVDAYERQLKLLKEEWGVTKGEVVRQIQENIELCKR